MPPAAAPSAGMQVTQGPVTPASRPILPEGRAADVPSVRRVTSDSGRVAPAAPGPAHVGSDAEPRIPAAPAPEALAAAGGPVAPTAEVTTETGVSESAPRSAGRPAPPEPQAHAGASAVRRETALPPWIADKGRPSAAEPVAAPPVSGYLARRSDMPLAQAGPKAEVPAHEDEPRGPRVVTAADMARALGAPTAPEISAGRVIQPTREALPLAAPPLARAPRVPAVQRVETEPPPSTQASAAALEQEDGEGGTPIDLDALARDVLPRLKRLLAIERERLPIW